MKLLALGIWIYENVSRSKYQKLRITSSIIITNMTDQAPAISDQEFFSCMLALFRYRDLGPMTVKLNCELDILKIYLQTENEVPRSTHCKLKVSPELKNTKLAQGKMSQFLVLPWFIFPPSYSNFYQQLCGQTDRCTHRQTLPKTIPGRSIAGMQVSKTDSHCWITETYLKV